MPSNSGANRTDTADKQSAHSKLTSSGRFSSFAHQVDRLNYAVCAILLMAVFGTQTLVVVLRYLFAIGFVELQNFVSYGFAAFCVLTIPLALRADKHVRVDVFRNNLHKKYHT